MKSLETSLKILSLFGRSRLSWTVTGLAREAGLNKSLVSKILSEFREAGILRQDPASREYTVAPFVVALAGNFMKSSRLCREALGPMRRLVQEVEQTVTLCILVDDEVMYLLSVEGPSFIDHGWRVGGWIPFHCTAAGKVLASGASDEKVDDMIARFGLPRHTATTVCDAHILKRQLKQISEVGFAITHSEGTAGLGAIAVPVLGEEQQVVAALGAVYTEHRVSPEKERSYVSRLHTAAQQLSFRLGAQVFPYGNAVDRTVA